MTVNEIEKELGLTRVCGGGADNRAVTGCHIGDLLSLVMSRAKSGDAWITIQGNINVPAVASLTDCAMVIIAEGMKLDPQAKSRADMEDIPVFESDKSAFELACCLRDCL